MLIFLFFVFRKALLHAEHNRRDAYLASAVDMGDLERRMRSAQFDG
ncbi:DUF3563 domain-containing protein [Paraburkholderia edwinii]|jgi:hypothetical protein|uniref:DUF3563 domain-containing protein n=1 Tax=Paraburkholderia edwinii TaxID=2861782 RepID=A0ABX8UMY3_9BURK|nr:DUF3563 family protein [Paraburkholderia edwinii]QYD68364.1 DUF3563 domain-containing protein [Paraburkholderia edwinii]